MPEQDGSIIPAAGFVLAGGRSTRMGQDKALLSLAGEPLIVRALAGLGRVCAEVAIAGGAPELARYGRLIPDSQPGCGPLSGLVAALEQTHSDWNLFIPVDVPFVPELVWRTLLAHAAAHPEAMCVMSRSDGQVQPLCAAYARAAAPVLRRELEAGHWKVTAAIALAGPVIFCDFAEPAWFRNVNTPAEFARVSEEGITDSAGRLRTAATPS